MKHRSIHAASLGCAAVMFIAALCAAPRAAAAITTTLNATSDNNIGPGGVLGDFDPALYGLVISGGDLAIIEFNPASIPGAAVIDTVNFRFYETSYTANGGAVNILGFGDNGIITAADATAAANLMANYQPSTLGLGSHVLSLNTSTLQSILGSGQFLAVRMERASLTNAPNTQIGSIE